MALPGVRTVLRDRFGTLSRTNLPDGIVVAAIARRSNVAGTERASGSGTTPADFDAYQPPNEHDVIDAFGDGSELHRAYIELVEGGAARIRLIALPADLTDIDLEDTAAGNPLEEAFGVVEAIQADIVVPWARGSDPNEWEDPATPGNDPSEIGFYADNSNATTTSFVNRVADLCRQVSDRSNPCFAVMGVGPYQGDANPDSSITPTNLAGHFTFPDLISIDDVENGAYVNVIAVELKPTGYPEEWGYANGAATYAGLISSINSENAPTGKRLFNTSALRYVPTRPQQESLIEKGLVPVNLNFERAAIIVDGLTFAQKTSDYIRLSTLRIVFTTVGIIRNAAQSYIGLPATIEHRNSLDTAISDRLRQMTVTGVLIDSDFTVTYVRAENKAIVDLVLRPAFEIRNIEISVAIDL